MTSPRTLLCVLAGLAAAPWLSCAGGSDSSESVQAALQVSGVRTAAVATSLQPAPFFAAETDGPADASPRLRPPFGPILPTMNLTDQVLSPGILELAESASGNAVADIDKDGRQDIIAAVGARGISVMRQRAAGTFEERLLMQRGNPFALSVGDFDNDGELDIAVISGILSSLTVWKGDGKGSFTAVSENSVTGTPRGMAVADFNLDGKLDVAVTTLGNPVSVFLGDGAGDFATGAPITGTSTATVIIATDQNSDGKPDLFYGDSTGKYLELRIGDGKGGFGAAITVVRSFSLGQIAIADLNADGRKDVVAVSGMDARLFLADSSNTFPGSTAISGVNGAYSGMAFVDVNLDGKLDLMVPENDAIAVLYGNGMGGFPTSRRVPIVNATSSFVVGEFDGKAGLDLMLSPYFSYFSAKRVMRVNGDGRGFFVTSHRLPALGATGVRTADLNEDGRPDLAFADTSGNLGIALATSAGGFDAVKRFTVGAGPRALVTADFNRDGHVDIAISSGGGNDAYVLLGDGAGNFPTSRRIPLDRSPTEIVAGDWNLDGKPDLAVAMPIQKEVWLLQGNGSGGFAPPMPISVSWKPTSLVVSDFDRDGKTDIAVGFDSTLRLVFLQGDGVGPFATPKILATTYYTDQLVGGDLSGDGIPDLIYISAINGEMHFMQGTGSFTFTDTNLGLMFKDVRRILAGDVNGDGMTDLFLCQDSYNSMLLLGGSRPAEYPSAWRLPIHTETCVGAALVDLDRNGRLDLAFSNTSVGTVKAIMNFSD